MSKHTEETAEVLRSLRYFNPNWNWLKFATHYKKKHGCELILYILHWLKNDVKTTRDGKPLNELNEKAYPYLKQIMENPFMEYIHKYIKNEQIKDLEALEKLLFTNIDNLTKETTPNWVIKARKRHKFLTWKKERSPDEDRELNKITFNLKKFGYSESQID